MLKIKACSIVIFLNLGHSYLPRILFLRQRPSYPFSFLPLDLPRIWRYDLITLSSVQSLSRVRLFVTPWTTTRQASLSITNCQSLPKPMSIESVMPSQPSHPLLSPSPPDLNLSQHQGLFKWISSLHPVAKVLEFQLQHQTFQWTPRTDLLQDGLVGSPCSPRDSQKFSPTPQFKSFNSSVLSFLYSPTLTSIHDYWKNHSLD